HPTIPPRALAKMLGIPALKFDYFHEGGGWWNSATVLSAAMLVYSGMCENVLVYTGANAYSEGRAERAGGGGSGARGPAQFTSPFGSYHAGVQFGHVATANMERY